MSRRRPFRELLEKLPPERRRRIKARAAKLHAKIEAAKAASASAQRTKGEQPARRPQETARSSAGEA